MSEFKDKRVVHSSILKKIKVLAMDVDGVLTDGVIYLDKKGDEFKTFHALDGLGIVLAKKSGLRTALISARESLALTRRAKELGVDALYQNRLEKKEAFLDLVRKFSVTPKEVCYVGDDLIDLVILRQVGFPVAVSNAVEEVKEHSFYVTSHSGGRGAVREVIEMILKAQGKWEEIVEKYL
ncbi:MAG: HAD hydrolase family protein [Chlamydiae bacterium]|nr:HAD hydrolase family protein [Chlamydiota bacterium]MBI3277482.1 HAD hydrolase family protein [Chlamydiota bacterium]